MSKTKTFIILAVTAVFISIITLSHQKNSSSQVQSKPTQYFQNQSETTPEATLTVTTEPTKIQETKTDTNSQTVSEIPKITCNFQEPPAPNQYGKGTITFSWNNLLPGKNKLVKVDVCVSANGNSPWVMFSSNQGHGSNEVTVSWLSSDVLYIFTLYDEHGGDLPDCGGVYLASCQIKTPTTPVVTPKK